MIDDAEVAEQKRAYEAASDVVFKEPEDKVRGNREGAARLTMVRCPGAAAVHGARVQRRSAKGA